MAQAAYGAKPQGSVRACRKAAGITFVSRETINGPVISEVSTVKTIDAPGVAHPDVVLSIYADRIDGHIREPIGGGIGVKTALIINGQPLGL